MNLYYLYFTLIFNIIYEHKVVFTFFLVKLNYIDKIINYLAL